MKSAMQKLFCLALVLTFLAVSYGSAAAAVSTEYFLGLCYSGTAQQVEEAIQAGADVNAKDQKGVTALMNAARWNSDLEVITVLAEAGADVNAKDQKGVTALMNAAGWNSNFEVITVLIKAGADVNAKDQNGETALIFAANKNPEAIPVLVDNGADPRDIAYIETQNIMSELRVLKAACLMFYADHTDELRAGKMALDIKHLIQYLDIPDKYTGGFHIATEDGGKWWVGYDLKSAGKYPDTREVLKGKVSGLSFYGEKSAGTPYTGQDIIWLFVQ